MNIIPTKIERRGDNGIYIEWSDGRKREYTAEELRKNCPCAKCLEEGWEKGSQDSHGPSLIILGQDDTQVLSVDDMAPVGNYAYKIQFSDGHDLGIYTFDILLKIGKEAG